MVYNPTKNDLRRAFQTPFFIQKMIDIREFLPLIKYALCVLLLIGIILAPAWVARQNGKGKPAMQAVRLGSWVFGWSIIAWLWALYQATKK
jgi:hypothetical protein